MRIRAPTTITVDEIDDRFDEIIDVRSPSEFAEDHIEGATNLPVLSDEERAEIGTVYKQTSTFLARRDGAAMIAGHAAGYLRGHFGSKDAGYYPLLYCWRGGMRSSSLATILGSVGWRVAVLEGGYKAFRRVVVGWLSREFDRVGLEFVVLAGLTGSGKTHVLRAMAENGHQVLDLEGLASHRGSLLGDEPGEAQPAQKRFENLLWQKLRAFDPSRPVFVESESHRIGVRQVPPAVWTAIKESPVIELAVSLEARVRFLMENYAHFSSDPGRLMDKLSPLKRLQGAERVAAWSALAGAGDWSALVEALLVEHYDPAYRRSRSKLFGEAAEVIESGDLGETSIARIAGEVARAGRRLGNKGGVSALPRV